MIKTDGETPGKRYGHTLSYAKPYIVLFGGHYINSRVNDTWILSIEKMPFVWNKVEFKTEIPEPRVYHTASSCTSGKFTGAIFIFGGRGKDQAPLSDQWKLHKNKDESWEWSKTEYKGDVVPTPRFQVQYNNFSIVLNLLVPLIL